MALLVIYDLRFMIYNLRLTPRASSFLLATLVTLLPVFIWDLNRRQVPDFLAQSLANYGGLITDTASVGERWWGFVGLLRYATASPALNLIFVAGLPALLIYGLTAARQPIRHFFQSQRKPETGHNPAPPRPHSSTDFLFTLFTLFFLLGHALFSFQAWDRYLLGLIPFLALLLARILLLPWSVLKTTWLDARPDRSSLAGVIYGLVLAGLLALTLTRPVQDAVNGRYPLGSHSQALSGIEQIVAYLQGHAGANHTLYHRWLGTHWRFYLWDYPYDLQYWASPQELALKAKPGHLIALPSWQSDTAARLALAGVGLTLHELTRAFNPAGYPSIILYQIVPGRP
jgi:hypothetical protein